MLCNIFTDVTQRNKTAKHDKWLAEQSRLLTLDVQFIIQLTYVRTFTALQLSNCNIPCCAGVDVIKPNHQMDVVRLADMAIDLFAMTAVLSRASRSYCLGFHNSQHEVRIPCF